MRGTVKRGSDTQIDERGNNIHSRSQEEIGMAAYQEAIQDVRV